MEKAAWVPVVERIRTAAVCAPKAAARDLEAVPVTDPDITRHPCVPRVIYGRRGHSILNNIETNLKRYLETECLLNNFFARFDYCASMCIKPAVESSGAKPVTACCGKKYYMRYDLEHPAFDLLRQERQRLYGKPAERNRTGPDSPCDYHNPRTGCRLATHKSPTCLAFLCPEAIEALRNEYGIYAYDYLGVYHALEWILTGDFPDHHFYAFRESIVDMTGRVKESP